MSLRVTKIVVVREGIRVSGRVIMKKRPMGIRIVRKE
jgi:hypothetical protein